MTIIDAGIGNLPSLVSAFLRVDVEAVIVSDPREFKPSDLAVLPGVGHWAPASERLKSSGWNDVISNYVSQNGRLLGICLGMQLLGQTSEEGFGYGLNLIHMKTLANSGLSGRSENLGWNRVDVLNDSKSWFGVDRDRAFYFTHKYSVQTNSSASAVLKSVDFAGVVAGVQMGNVIGVQFHPERSGKSGIDFLSNVSKWASN